MAHEIPASLLARALKHAEERDRIARETVIRFQFCTGVRLSDSARETLVAMIVTRLTHQYHLGRRFEEKVEAAPPLVRLGPGGEYTRDYSPETTHA